MAGLRRIQKAKNSQGTPIRIDGVVQPGTKLKEEIKWLGIQQKEAACLLGIPPSNLNDVIRGVRGISIGLALKLEKVFGFDAEYWLGMQVEYDLKHARHDHLFSKKLSKLKRFSPG